MNKRIFIINLTNAYVENIEKGIKYVEIAMQNVIEKEYNQTWWKVCTLGIFNELLVWQGDPIFLADKIFQNIENNN